MPEQLREVNHNVLLHQTTATKNGPNREHHSPTRPDKIIDIYIVAYFCKIIKKNYFTTPYILNI